jgi:hypothetical protein
MTHHLENRRHIREGDWRGAVEGFVAERLRSLPSGMGGSFRTQAARPEHRNRSGEDAP